MFNPYGHGWHIARNRFDAMLAQRAEEQGARVYRGADVTACAPSPGGWQVAVSIGGQPSALNAAFLVDATGRAASVARRLGARRVTADRLTGIAGFFADRRDPAARDSRTLVEAAPDGWWYSAELPDDRLIAVYLTDADLLPKGRLDVGYWQARLAQTTHTRGRVSGGALESLRAFNANSSRLDRFSGPGWLAVGDAAAAVDPLSSQGISRALESGLQAAQAIEQYLGGNAEGLPAYARWLERGFEDYLRRRAIYYGWERRWPDSVFWQRRQ
ncbi:MAG: tryptophan 7-halogenase [Chloroflexi bacterium]|nr:tryptophan 7-halogenase [Chloroflexota bacterium]